MKVFEERFSDANHIAVTVRSVFDQYGSYIDSARSQILELRKSILPLHSSISDNIGRVGEAHLLVMYEGVASVGLSRWAPDVLGDPNSIYNLLHETVCLFTFRQVASAFGYSFMGVNLEVVMRSSLLSQFYRSFVFGHMRGQARVETRNSGRVAEIAQLKGAYDRRGTVSNIPLALDTLHSF